MEEKRRRDNNTVVKLVFVKVKQKPNPHFSHELGAKKVWTVYVIDIEYLTVKLSGVSDEIKSIKQEHNQLQNHASSIDDSIIGHVQRLEQLNQFKPVQRCFRIPPEQHEVKVTETPSGLCDIKESFTVK